MRRRGFGRDDGSGDGGTPDSDGDGIPDVFAGSTGDDDGSADSGAVYVLFLKKDGSLKKMQKISNTEGGLATALGRQLETDGAFGESCAALGDYDGDGVPDAMVGAPQTGTSGVLYMLLLNKDGTVKKASTISADTGGFGMVSWAAGVCDAALTAPSDTIMKLLYRELY